MVIVSDVGDSRFQIVFIPTCIRGVNQKAIMKSLTYIIYCDGMWSQTFAPVVHAVA